MPSESAVFVRRIKLLPDKEEARTLDGQSRKCCWLYNCLKEKADSLRQEYVRHQSNDVARTLYSKRGLRNLVPGIKKTNSFLNLVYSSPLKNTALRLSKSIGAYQASAKGQRPGPRIAWPQFHKWKQEWFSLEYDEPNKGFRFRDGTLELSLGKDANKKQLKLVVPLSESAPELKKARNLRVVKEGTDYWAVVTIKRALPKPKPIVKAVALDPNIKNFAYGVGTEGRAFCIANAPGLKALDLRIDNIKQHRDNCKRKSILMEVPHENGHVTRYWRPSRRWHRYDMALKRAEQKRRDQSKHFLFCAANKLCREYDLIGIGDFAPEQHDTGLGKKANRQIKNRSLLGRFKPILLWVALRSGKTAMVYDETGTTRTCNICHTIVEGGIPPHIRTWTCKRCHTTHDRDENAAQNGLERILRARNLNLPRSGPVTSRCDWRFQPQGWCEVPQGDANVNQIRCSELTEQFGEVSVTDMNSNGMIATGPMLAQI
jgi:putative transposase